MHPPCHPVKSRLPVCVPCAVRPAATGAHTRAAWRIYERHRNAWAAASAGIDGAHIRLDTAFMVALNEAYAKLSALSDERAQRVLSLIEDLAELEARENAEDLAAAGESLAEYRKTGEAITLDELDKRLAL